MLKSKVVMQDLTDEQILKEFVKRFKCDGAILIYLDENTEFGFGRWANSFGRAWVNNLLNSIKRDVSFTAKKTSLMKRKFTSV